MDTYQYTGTEAICLHSGYKFERIDGPGPTGKGRDVLPGEVLLLADPFAMPYWLPLPEEDAAASAKASADELGEVADEAKAAAPKPRRRSRKAKEVEDGQ